MHALLARQLKDAGIDANAMSVQVDALVQAVDATYGRSESVRRFEQPSSPGAEASHPTAIREARLLLVEMDETEQMEISENLTGAGFACDIAPDAAKAVAAVGRQAYDAVLVDCQTPAVDGAPAIAALRAADSARTKATASACPTLILALGAAGADRFVFKSADPNNLVKTLNELLAPPPAAKAPIEAPPALPPMDLDALLVRCMGDVQFRGRLLEMFPAQFNGCMTKITDALTAGDAQQTARAAHGLKGAAANLSATAVQCLASRIEILGTEGAVADARKLVDELQAEVDRCLTFARQTPAAAKP